MRVRELIAELQKLDPNLHVVTIGEGDAPWRHDGPAIVYVDDPEDPSSWDRRPSQSNPRQAVRL